MTNIKSSQPKYKKIGEQLITDILNGYYQVGDSLATEKALCLKFNVSRHTIRDALRYVEQRGLIKKIQGSGSVVISTQLPCTINQVVQSVEDLLQHGNDTLFDVIQSEFVDVDENLKSLLDITEHQLCLCTSGIRIEPHSKKPVCFTKIYQIATDKINNEQPLNNRIAFKAILNTLDSKNIGRIEQTISACSMPKHLAHCLSTETNSPALKIVRRYFSNNNKDIILVAESLYAENRYSFSSTLYPE